MDIPGMWKFGLSVLEMIIVGQILIRVFGFSGEIGLILLRSKKGIETIDRLSKNHALWQFLSDMGTTMAYGLMSVVLMRKNTSVKSVIAGFLVLLVLAYVIAPSVFPFLTQVLNVSIVEKAQSQIGATPSIVTVLIGVVAILLGGLFLLLVSSIIYYGLFIIFSLYRNLSGGGGELPAPGGTLLLPGVNLPLFEGIAALLIILAVHEVAHAILARVGKVPVLSSGLVLFGVIPIGAFVEPDERKLAKKNKLIQTRVLIAGSTSNLYFSIIFFVAFLLYSNYVATFDFLYYVLGMSFALNFIVGTVNLLPLPFFDGYRALDVNVENKMIVKSIMYITLIAFALNFLPHFFS
jgi:membrane-associated protease RseP (regulator of RpoE activity)